MKSVLRSGSSPAPSQSAAISIVFVGDLALGRVGGQRVPVGHEVEAVEVVLEPHPVVQGAEIVAEVQPAGRPHPRQHALASGHRSRPIPAREVRRQPVDVGRGVHPDRAVRGEQRPGCGRRARAPGAAPGAPSARAAWARGRA